MVPPKAGVAEGVVEELRLGVVQGLKVKGGSARVGWKWVGGGMLEGYGLGLLA